MTARRAAILTLVTVLASTGLYVFVYLYRWEWNRAIVVGILFVIAEVALIGLLVLERLRAISRDIHDFRTRGPDPAVLARVREAAPEPREAFAWLRDVDRISVFVPVLMGAGVVLSAIAWAVERIARNAAGPTLESGLARRLGVLSLPSHLVVEADDPLRLLAGPRL